LENEAVCYAHDAGQTSCHNWEGLHTCLEPKGHKGEHICGGKDHRWPNTVEVLIVDDGRTANLLEAIKLVTGGIGIGTMIDAMFVPGAEADLMAAMSQGLKQDITGDADPDWVAYNEYLKTRTPADPYYTFSGWARANNRRPRD
jgi:hypothetical protein